MKKYFILISFAALVFACKNDSKTEPASQLSSPESAAPTALQSQEPEINLDGASKILNDVNNLLKEIDALRKQVDALPDAIKREKATEVENLRSMLNDMEERENTFVEQLNTAISANSGASTPTNSNASNSLTYEGISAVREVATNQPVVVKDFEALKAQFKDLSKR